MIDLASLPQDVMLAHKRCNRCGEDLPVKEFNADRGKRDGLRTICKACTKKTSSTIEAKAAAAARLRALRKNEKWAAYYKECAKRWIKTEKGKAYVALQGKKLAALYPKKRSARRAVNDAVRAGRLPKQPCFCCGDIVVEAHHADYDRPLDVVWLCNKHHNEIHNDKSFRHTG